MTESCRRDVSPFCKVTEGCRKDVLPFCKVTEGRRKMFEHSVKLQKVAAKMFGLSVRKKEWKIKIPHIFFLLSEGFFIEVFKLFYQLFKIITVTAFSVFFGRF